MSGVGAEEETRRVGSWSRTRTEGDGDTKKEWETDSGREKAVRQTEGVRLKPAHTCQALAQAGTQRLAFPGCPAAVPEILARGGKTPSTAGPAAPPCQWEPLGPHL